MDFKILTGILLIATGSFSAGSFAVPFGKIRGWPWETYWMIFSLGAYIVIPLLACLIFAPNFISIIQQTDSRTLLSVFLLGAVYGIGNLSFGLSLRYLGLSLGYALSLGLMLAIGTLIPPLIDGRLELILQKNGGMFLIYGIITASIGIALSAWSGILKDKQVSDSDKKDSIYEFNLVKGIFAAVLVGITGSAMSLGFERGLPLVKIASLYRVDELFTIMPLMVVLLAGTFVTTIIWCGYLGKKNNTLSGYVRAENVQTLLLNYLYGMLAGFLWFSQFILYGMGKSKMGPFTFTSWGILMALTIVFASVWGLIRKEWKGASTKVYILMVLSLIIIIVASFMIGISGSE